MPPSPPYGEALVGFLDDLVSEAIRRRLVSYDRQSGRYQLTDAGREVLGGRPGNGWANDVLRALQRLGEACDLRVPRVP